MLSPLAVAVFVAVAVNVAPLVIEAFAPVASYADVLCAVRPRTRAPAPVTAPTPTRLASASALFVAVADALSEPARRSAVGPRYALVAPRAFDVGKTTAMESPPTPMLCVMARVRVSRSVAVIVTAPPMIALPLTNAAVVA